MSRKLARKLAKAFPYEVAGFTLPQIESIWAEHSAEACAQWLIPEQEEVEDVFDAATEKLAGWLFIT